MLQWLRWIKRRFITVSFLAAFATAAQSDAASIDSNNNNHAYDTRGINIRNIPRIDDDSRYKGNDYSAQSGIPSSALHRPPLSLRRHRHRSSHSSAAAGAVFMYGLPRWLGGDQLHGKVLGVQVTAERPSYNFEFRPFVNYKLGSMAASLYVAHLWVPACFVLRKRKRKKVGEKKARVRPNDSRGSSVIITRQIEHQT